MKKLLLSLLYIFCLEAAQSYEAPPVALKVLEAKPAPDIDAVFQNRLGWIGADGVHSIRLASGKRIWLFSDTWVGRVENGKPDRT